MDTGCTITLGFTDLDGHLTKKRKSNITIHTAAKGSHMNASYSGVLSMDVMNTAQDPTLPETIPFQMDMLTVPNLSEELLSVDKFYAQQGYEIFLTHPSKGGHPHMRKGNRKIPFRYDYLNKGFFMDYIPKHNTRVNLESVENPHQHSEKANLTRQIDTAVLHNVHTQLKHNNNPHNVEMLRHNCFTAKVAAHLHSRCTDSPVVTEVVRVVPDMLPTKQMTVDPALKRDAQLKRKVSEMYLSLHPDEREIRGVKSGLRKIKRKLPVKEFHENHGHLGECPNCTICRAVKGSMRRIVKHVDPHREKRPGYSFSMDMITFDTRSLEQHKYLICIKCNASSYYTLLPLQAKSQATNAVSNWIKSLRSDPLIQDVGYDPVMHIRTDMAGEWRANCSTWNAEIRDALKVTMEYVAPERHESNGIAERACGIAEATIKSLLMQNNLPPSWWSRCSKDAEFLLNRFPLTSTHIMTPLDGDRPRPI